MPAAFFTPVRNPEPFRRGPIPITLISRPLSLATVQEVLETAGDEEEEDRDQIDLTLRDEQNAVLGREKGGLQVDERTSREGHCRCVRPGGIGSLPGDGAGWANTYPWY